MGIALRIGSLAVGSASSSSYWTTPCTPTNVTLTEITGGVKIDWSIGACTTYDGFEVWVSDNGGDYSKLTTVGAATLTHNDMTSYMVGHVISYKIRSGYLWTYSDFSDPSSQIVDTSYANSGGTGDRRAIIDVTISASTMAGAGAANVLVDGITSAATNKYFSPPLSNTGKYILFDFKAGASKVITEAKFYQSGTQTHATWQWQGSNNGADFTNIGATFTLGGATTQTITTLSGNSSGYRYYRLLGVTGNPSESPYVYEFQFKISA